VPPVGFEIPASERPQTHPLDSAATGTGSTFYMSDVIAGCNYRIHVCNYWPTNNIHAQYVVYLWRTFIPNFMFLPETVH